MRTVQESIASSLRFARMVTGMILDGLDDADLLVRPVPGANHIAWQLGHLICTEHMIIGMIPGADMPALPDGFAENYTKDTSASDDSAKFASKATYVELYDKVRVATESLLSRMSDEEMEKDAPEPVLMIAPKVADAFALMASHESMHVGQYTVVRRKLGKPVAF